MKAAQIAEPGKVVIIDLPKPEVGPGEVLIEMRQLGLCGSDIKTYQNQNPMVTFPRIPGHEIGGVIVEKGANVPESLKTGEKVTVSPYTACGECSSCRVGRVNCCKFNQTLGVQRDGAAQEYIAVPYEKVIPAPTLSFEEIASIEPISVGWHATNRGEVKAGEYVLVFGCGVIGLGAIIAAASKGAHVIAVDIDSNKLEKAKNLGAEFTINSKETDLTAEVMKITSDDGPSVVIEAVGLPLTFRAAVDLVCFAGRVVYIGYAKAPVEYETKHFVAKELDIRGSRNALQHEIAEVTEMLMSGKVDISPFITQRYKFEELGEALEFWGKNINDVTKIVLEM